MFALERVRIIREYLQEHRKAEVQGLSNLLAVSEVTIRRDLMKLEKEGFLTRTHGGAVMNDDGPSPTPTTDILGDAAVHSRQLDELATVGIRMIQSGDVVMLTDGDANVRVAERLQERTGVTVLTNDLRIASVVARTRVNRAVLLGGDLSEEGVAVYGSLSLENLRRYSVNTLFVEVDGISQHLELTVRDQKKADLITAAAAAVRIVLVCPAERFGRSAFFRFADTRFGQVMLTNADLAEDYKNRLFSSGITLFTAIDVFEGHV